MRQAFSLIEMLIAIALSGVMAYTVAFYLDTNEISKQNVKTQLQSHFNIITSIILQCKEYSNVFPIQNNGSLASSTLLNTLECNTSTPYLLDGGKGSFIPPALKNFTAYTATQTGSEFYFTTTTAINSTNDEVLIDLNTTFSPNQYVLTHDATTAYLNFYLSR
ncbi:prepilin-type N-terminal cleavage/methylation domain-containing protein [Candidatus Sulfurimonas marisnigri]|uniref:Prepilin-type N-terminal cleavage/methylation domain-containing protein n=1 Tax=Candidatus Sulfurimonas marisnigri TaxID=2740405 RepID=A0A7S7RR84_9BACT|nr:prepilin-type N-terminal cleavage/methylation domain-containing protein [Candidatus Sulfurimonas marisnigri]QOY55393.1 prepilin-type N-terminal cleavage/methylation domain-containing protein [Candidatus Sulfurimonas marisnigri]